MCKHESNSCLLTCVSLIYIYLYIYGTHHWRIFFLLFGRSRLKFKVFRALIYKNFALWDLYKLLLLQVLIFQILNFWSMLFSKTSFCSCSLLGLDFDYLTLNITTILHNKHQLKTWLYLLCKTSYMKDWF